jgi:formylglycine-generating enzyme required for sulfatase activity
VQSFPANALGFLNLGGNVAEWAHDLYTITPSVEGQASRDPVGPAEGEYHVIRGASWMHATVTELRLSYRDYGKDARPDVGFRVARYAE